jgi:hypothetical protein
MEFYSSLTLKIYLLYEHIKKIQELIDGCRTLSENQSEHYERSGGF